MKIAVLGWGSLIWDPRELALDTQWRSDGPTLPIEFARKSGTPNADRLTLVLFETGAPVQVLWAISKYTDLPPAIANLAARERHAPIGYVKVEPNDPTAPLPQRSTMAAIAPGAVKDQLLGQIDLWRSSHGTDAVIWTDLDSNFPGVTPQSAVNWLRVLVATDKTGRAEQYVRRAPMPVRTPVRDRIEDELGWLPLRQSLINSADDLRFKEWTECRAAIARLDGILVDLRKVGFSFITALLTASSFLSLLGQPGQTGVAAPIQARAAAFVAILVLVAALFAVDSYYSVLLSASVERALDLEVQTDPPVRITKYLSINAARSLATWVTLGVYLVLLVTAGAIGVLAVAGKATQKNEFDWTWNVAQWSGLAYVVAAIGVALGVAMIGYWFFAAWKTGFHRRKKERTWRPGEDPTKKVAEP